MAWPASNVVPLVRVPEEVSLHAPAVPNQVGAQKRYQS